MLSRPASQGILASLAAPVTLTSAYFGLHFHRYPGGTTPAPSVTFGTVRSQDYLPDSAPISNFQWWRYEPTDGDYRYTNAQTSPCQNWVDTHDAAGRDKIVVLGFPPTWASARPTEPGAYGNGTAAEPANMAKWSEYVTDLATRAAGKVEYYEILNEPSRLERTGADLISPIGAADTSFDVFFQNPRHYRVGGADVWIPAAGFTGRIDDEKIIVGSTGGYGSGNFSSVTRGAHGTTAVSHAAGSRLWIIGSYFTGKTAQLVTMMRLAYTAIKAADPAALVISPSTNGDIQGIAVLDSILDATDGVGYGRDYCDAIGFHLYGFNFDASGNLVTGQGMREARAFSELGAKFDKPIINTEFGYTDWAAIPAARRRDCLWKLMLIPVLFGCQKSIYFSYDAGSTRALKYPVDTGATIDLTADWDALVSTFTASQIVMGQLDINGLLTIKLANGAIYRI
jgi:hypothetical protein